MPPSMESNPPPTEDIAMVNEKHTLQGFADAALSLSNKGINALKERTPTRMATVIESTQQSVTNYVTPAYDNRVKPLVAALDRRIDPVMDRVGDIVQLESGFKAKAEAIVGDSLTGLGFVASATKASLSDTLDEADEEDDERVSFYQLAQDKVSSVCAAVSQNYYKVLETADHEIEVWLPETIDGETASSQKTPLSVINKGAKRLRPTATKRLNDLKKRSNEQLQAFIHVDLISYASEVIDVSAAATPLAVKGAVDSVITNVAQLNTMKDAAVQNATTKVAHVNTMVQEKTENARSVASSKLQPVLASLYSEKLAQAYLRASEAASKQCNSIVLTLKSTKQFVSDKVVLVYNDGVKALVVELRSEGFLPAEGKATIASALEMAAVVPSHIRARAMTLAQEVISQAQKMSVLAQAKLQDLFVMLLAAKEDLTTKAIGYYEAMMAFAYTQAAELVALAQQSREKATLKVTELYAWLLSQTPELQEKLKQFTEQVKEQTTKFTMALQQAPAAVEERFPHVVAKLRLAAEKMSVQGSLAKEFVNKTYNDRKPALEERFQYLVTRLQEAKKQIEDAVMPALQKSADWAEAQCPARVADVVQELRKGAWREQLSQEKAKELLSQWLCAARGRVFATLGMLTEANTIVEAQKEADAEESDAAHDPLDAKFEANNSEGDDIFEDADGGVEHEEADSVFARSRLQNAGKSIAAQQKVVSAMTEEMQSSKETDEAEAVAEAVAEACFTPPKPRMSAAEASMRCCD